MGSWSWSRSQSLWPAAAPPEVSKTSRARPPRPARRPASAPPCARSRSAGSGPCPTTQGAGPRPAADRPGRHRSCPRPLPARRPGPLPAAGAQRRRRRADHRPAGARLSVHPSLGAVAPTPPRPANPDRRGLPPEVNAVLEVPALLGQLRQHVLALAVEPSQEGLVLLGEERRAGAPLGGVLRQAGDPDASFAHDAGRADAHRRMRRLGLDLRLGPG